MVAPWILWLGGLGLAGAGGYAYMQTRPGDPDNGSVQPGGQTVGNIDRTNAMSAEIENQSLGFDAYPISYAAGPAISTIDGGFFGAGPQSDWSGQRDYTDVFGGGAGYGEYRSRGGRGRFSRHQYDNHRPGAGGFGRHRRRWDGEALPAGGEGWENNGQNHRGEGGGMAAGGGMPWAQQTTMGTSGYQYQTQQGDTLSGIANRYWGNGASFEGLQSANNNLGGYGGTDQLQAGMSLTIPGAPSSGPPSPGGPAGNGIGGGSVGANGYNSGVNGADPSHGPGQAYPGAGTASAGASGGGSPTAGQSGGNSSRVKSGNASSNYATGGGKSGVQTSNKQKSTTSAPARNRPSSKRK